MNILLTNDDGIDSPGLTLLAAELREKTSHRVFVLAPDSNRSAISHGLSFILNPLRLKQLGEDSWSCSGNPADCVIAALNGVLPLRPDLVLSGINQGANLGLDIMYSGTAAGARQASFGGIPGIALSLSGRGPYNWDMAVGWIVENLETLYSCWRAGTMVNVNIPDGPAAPEGVHHTWPGPHSSFKDKLAIYTAPDGDRWCFLDTEHNTMDPKPGSDFYAIARNHVSISVLFSYPVVQRDFCPEAPVSVAPELQT
ncbi:MAG: 5'/3'-nucleotidase SurE [Treponema sp.]|nr:5'/3'-nucleotidase SurE [Treponema sp.]